MSLPAWVLNADAFALATAAKTAINLIAASGVPINAIAEISVSIDSTALVLVELCESTQATAGTPTGSPVAKQTRGFLAGDTTTPTVTLGFKYSAEPTTLTRLKAWRFTGPGPFVIQFPLGREPQSLLSGSSKYKALALRLTASTGTPSSDSYIEWE
jgi:hypothetical protein